MKRITPLNIVIAILLIWLGFGLIDGTLPTGKALWVLLLIVVCVIGDQLIRISLKNLKRIWMMQMLIIIIAVIGAFVILYINN